MLSIFYEAGPKQFHFVFDVPLPVDLMDHPELKSFRKRISDTCTLIRDGNGDLKSVVLSSLKLKMFFFSSLDSEERDFYLSTLQHLVDRGKLPPPKGLDVNFHQKPFDTSFRYWRFILSQGNFERYFYNRMGWFLAPVSGLVAEFPLHVDIETASTCNMDCPMCYRRMLKNTGQMAPELFYKIIDECAKEDVFSVRLSWRGEPLTHPRIEDLITYAAKKIPNVSFLTNAFYINESIAQCMIENQLSYIAISFDGIGDVYEKIRAPASFTESRERIAKLKRLRDAAGSGLPQIRLCTIWPAIKEDPDAYYQAMNSVSDYIVYNPYINFTGPMSIKSDFICQYPWERLVVAYNGDTQCCTGWNGTDIILGNAVDTSLKKMWHSGQMDEIRRMHSSGCRLELESCSRCRHGSTGETDIRIDEILDRRW